MDYEITDNLLRKHPEVFDSRLLNELIILEQERLAYERSLLPPLPEMTYGSWKTELTYDELLNSVIVNPATVQPYFPYGPNPLYGQSSPIKSSYHPSLDHDYCSNTKNEDNHVVPQIEECMEIGNSDVEPVVEVWELEGLYMKPAVDSAPESVVPPQQPLKNVTRRTSSRTAEIKRKQQERKFTTAVQAELQKEKPRKARQYKAIQPKNSVETTPYQSDMEEFYGQPVKAKQTKITKKKTTKGRIDHSQSERQRRNVQRSLLNALSSVIPQKYLIGDKASSQVSKQKILNGGKNYIVDLRESNKHYRDEFKKNSSLNVKFWGLLNSLTRTPKL